MQSKILMLALSAVALSAAGIFAAVAPAKSAPSTHALVIHHQIHGCHSWAVDGGTYGVSRTVSLARGGSILVRNDDVMPHKLIKTSGAAVTITRVSSGTSMGLKGTSAPAMLARMHSSARLTFAHAGVYRFTTRAGEDYMSGVKTTGDDNMLRLKVIVA